MACPGAHAMRAPRPPGPGPSTDVGSAATRTPPPWYPAGKNRARRAPVLPRPRNHPEKTWTLQKNGALEMFGRTRAAKSIWIGDSDLINVRFGPLCRLKSDISRGPRCAKRRHMQRSKRRDYSITSSAAASSVAGISMPSVLAVCRLMTNSNLVGCWTGISAGFSPLRMRPTETPVWRYWSERSDP
jgi:hypothetical protein